MPLFRRNKKHNDEGGDAAPKKEKGSWRRPANTAFKQQRLKAWQPILTPKTVLPTLFIIGIVFAPIGGLLVWGSGLVSEMTFDYTQCEKQTPSSSLSQLNFVNLPKYSYRLRSSESKAPVTPPQFAFLDQSNNTSIDVSAQRQCIIQFDVPINLEPTVLLYYKLTNFYQNHRRYVNSLDQKQLKGSYVAPHSLNSGECSPLATVSGGKIIYPCGLIANSLFNDSYSGLTSTTDSSSTYNFSSTGIAWPGEENKYAASPGYPISTLVPPPNWSARFPSGYSNSTPPPNLKTDQRFQNWMRTAGLPTFTKLFGRNDNTTLQKGRYQITVNLNYPVLPYSGTKSIVISTVSWIGGKNPFLGWAYVASAALLIFLAVLGTIRHMVKPRKLGDMSLLSWNRS
ncbi:cell cycle control protein [Sparassis latifolia]|uniref:Meiotically up-regulated gene 89 protein n=1 Tax=Sparassis crispa TaxID=139825 RepID=A0A401GK33_9APHY|nr:Meiotically up-regulated gene 89 protein [Sparassis crispa]GBE82525.1 Meiotically up-regulated gene 89 protein [Sparassis crispa]